MPFFGYTETHLHEDVSNFGKEVFRHFLGRKPTATESQEIKQMGERWEAKHTSTSVNPEM